MAHSPSGSIATLRPDLAEFIEFDLAANRMGYIAPRAAPIVNVSLASDNVGKIAIEDLLPALDGTSTNRQAGSGYKRGNYNFTTYSYTTEEHGAEETVDDRDEARYKHVIGGADKIATERALTRVLGNYERRTADLLFNTTTWTGAALTTGVSTEWSTAASATPIADVRAAKQKIWNGSGLDANALICNRDVFQNLLLVDEVQDMIASSGAGQSYMQGRITEQMLAEALGLDMVIVAGGTRNGANSGQAASPTRLWSSEYAMVAKVATGADPREACVARTFHWTEDGSTEGGTVEEYREEAVRGRVIRVRFDSDEVVMYAEAAHLLSNITA